MHESAAAWQKSRNLRKNSCDCVEKMNNRGWKKRPLSNVTLELVVLSDVGRALVRYVFFFAAKRSIFTIRRPGSNIGGMEFRLYVGTPVGWAVS